jgi:hypothetical protein
LVIFEGKLSRAFSDTFALYACPKSSRACRS